LDAILGEEENSRPAQAEAATLHIPKKFKERPIPAASGAASVLILRASQGLYSKRGHSRSCALLIDLSKL
jgi:hypothetical protein